MKRVPLLIITLVLLLIGSDLHAQRGGRSGSSRSKKKSSLLSSDFKNRLWYGAGGTLNFQGINGFNSFSVGILPMVGYKFNDVLSAGPRLGVIYTGVKGETTNGSRQRVNLWTYTAGGFVRARVTNFYVQADLNFESNQFFFQDNFGRIALDPNDLRPLTEREGRTTLYAGIGYNAGLGGVSSDIGIFYDIFDDVDRNSLPLDFRIILTFGY